MTYTHDAQMISHAARRGAVRTPQGIGALQGWPKSTNYAVVVIRGKHYRPLKALVQRIDCSVCDFPADAGLAASGIHLCRFCAEDEAKQND